MLGWLRSVFSASGVIAPAPEPSPAERASLSRWASKLLLRAAAEDDVAAARFALAIGASADGVAGDVPLCVAARLRRVAVATVLLDAGASPNRRDGVGRTPLLHATSVLLDGRLGLPVRENELAALLLARGADPDLATPGGATPLMYAVDVDDDALVALLLAHSASVEPSIEGLRAIDLAAANHSPDLVRLLATHGAVPRAAARPDESGSPYKASPWHTREFPRWEERSALASRVARAITTPESVLRSIAVLGDAAPERLLRELEGGLFACVPVHWWGDELTDSLRSLARTIASRLRATTDALASAPAPREAQDSASPGTLLTRALIGLHLHVGRAGDEDVRAAIADALEHLPMPPGDRAALGARAARIRPWLPLPEALRIRDVRVRPWPTATRLLGASPARGAVYGFDLLVRSDSLARAAFLPDAEAGDAPEWLPVGYGRFRRPGAGAPMDVHLVLRARERAATPLFAAGTLERAVAKCDLGDVKVVEHALPVVSVSHPSERGNDGHTVEWSMDVSCQGVTFEARDSSRDWEHRPSASGTFGATRDGALVVVHDGTAYRLPEGPALDADVDFLVLDEAWSGP